MKKKQYKSLLITNHLEAWSRTNSRNVMYIRYTSDKEQCPT